jgi:hypothetical protein
MAKLAGNLAFTGSVGDMSAYRMQGVDKIIIRNKPVISRHRRLHHGNYALTRLYSQEWKGCTMAGQLIRRAMHGVKHLSDYNFSGVLNGLCKNIQKDDTVSVLGTRSVLLSKYGYKLEGFCLTKYHSFSSLFRSPINSVVDITTGTAAVQMPEVIPGINFFNPRQQPLYRFVFLLSAVPDIIYDAERKIFCQTIEQTAHSAIVTSGWKSQNESTEAGEFNLQLTNYQPMPDDNNLMLCAGIEFGTPVSNTEIKFVKYAGSAMVLRFVS